MNDYKVFYKLEKGISKVINIIISVLIILGGLGLIILSKSSSIFNIIVILALILFILNSIIERKDTILKEQNKAFLDKPIIFDNNDNVYVLIDKSSKVLLIMAVIIILLQFGGDSLYFIIVWCLLIAIELGKFLRSFNINYLRKNTNAIYKIINKNNLRYIVLKVNRIVTNDNNSYIMEFSNNTSRNLFISNDYNNYDELIQLINKKVNMQ